MGFYATQGPAFIRQAADYALTSQTAAQQLFNTTTNGRITLSLGVYRISGVLYLINMSATSGNADFNLLGAGSAILAGQAIEMAGREGSANVVAAAGNSALISLQNNLGFDAVAPTTGTTMHFALQGMFTVTTAGTVQPSIALTTAAAASVKQGSFLVIEKLAETGVNSKGAWD